MKCKFNSEDGFSIIELTIVIILISLITLIVVPNLINQLRVTKSKLIHAENKLKPAQEMLEKTKIKLNKTEIELLRNKINTTKSNLQVITLAAKLYYSDNKNWPASIQKIVESGYLIEIPDEMLTPSSKEVSVRDNSGGWFYQTNAGAEPPLIQVNVLDAESLLK